jgi:ribosomal protein L17
MFGCSGPALALELHQEVKLTTGEKVKKLRLVARTLVNNAIDGDTTAARECFDRMDGKVAQSLMRLKCAATSRSPGCGQRIDVLKPLKRYFRRSSWRRLLFLFWRQQPVTLRATHRSVVSPLAAVPLAVLAAASSSGSLAIVGGDAPGLVAGEELRGLGLALRSIAAGLASTCPAGSWGGRPGFFRR